LLGDSLPPNLRYNLRFLSSLSRCLCVEPFSATPFVLVSDFMLIISKASRCDVCLEYYGSDSNSHPCVIPCGHTFCRRCISNLSPVICPLCRQHYDPRQPRRLVVDVDPDNASPSSESHCGDKLGSPTPDPASEEADRLQARFTDVVTHGSTEPTLRALINDCSAFLRNYPNRFPQLRFSMRTISYLADTRTKSRSQAGTITSLAAEVSTLRGDLELQKSDFEKQIEELTERTQSEAEASRKENEELVSQNESLAIEFKNLKQDYARLASKCRRLAALTGQPAAEFNDVDVEIDEEDAGDIPDEDEEQRPEDTLFSPMPSADVSPLCDNILSPMPEIPSLSALSYQDSEAASTPFDDNRSTLTMEDPPLLTPQREELPFPFVPASPAVDMRSHSSSRTRGHSFISAAGDEVILPPLRDPSIEEVDSEASSPIIPPSAIPRPTQGGLSLTAPHRRRYSNNYSPPRVGSYHEEKSGKDVSPNLSRLHDLLSYSTHPTTSSSLPVFQGSPLSRRSSRRDIPHSRHHSPSPRNEAPMASPPSSKVSSASQAAMILEAKKAERQRAERYPREMPLSASNRLSRNSVDMDYAIGSTSLPSSTSLSRMNSLASNSKRGMTSSSNYATLGYKKSNSGLREDHNGKMYMDKRDDSNRYSTDNTRKMSNQNQHLGLSAMHP